MKRYVRYTATIGDIEKAKRLFDETFEDGLFHSVYRTTTKANPANYINNIDKYNALYGCGLKVISIDEVYDK
jgi:hypothetical protein